MAYKQPATFTEIVDSSLNEPRVSYRVHGQGGELRKPMFHRFPVRGGISMREEMTRTLTMRNPFFERLSRTSTRR